MSDDSALPTLPTPEAERQRISLAIAGGLILRAMGSLFHRFWLGIGYGAINLAQMRNLSWWLMFLLVIAKIPAMTITIGSGGSGGIFAHPFS